jgi:sialate O-acetylesterase
MTIRRLTIILIAILAVAAPRASRANITLPDLFADHMVIQRSAATPIFGTAEPGQSVSVTIANHKAITTADSAGHFLVHVDLSHDLGPAEILFQQGTDRIVLSDVLVGDVWLCSGQSNMEFALHSASNGPAEVAQADHPHIRLFLVKRATANTPQEQLQGQWQVCSPKSAAGFSAVGYFFAREINNQTKVPIGLIGSYWGGTTAEAWTSAPAVAANPALASLATPAPSAAPATTPDHPYPQRTAILFNAMIHPLLGTAIKGVIWYQGESNASRAVQYRALFPALIQDWRADWNEGNFPFYFVQLPNWIAHKDVPGTEPFSDWAELREAQLRTLALPNTAMAITIDIGDPHNLHPTNKQEVGRRLALIALARDYGQDIEYSGPICKSFTVDPDHHDFIIHFIHANGLRPATGKTILGFEIAGQDHKWQPATVTVQGASVVLTSPAVADPIAARYAWSDSPACNLINSVKLPASPFRTDDWPRHSQSQ